MAESTADVTCTFAGPFSSINDFGIVFRQSLYPLLAALNTDRPIAPPYNTREHVKLLALLATRLACRINIEHNATNTAAAAQRYLDNLTKRLNAGMEMTVEEARIVGNSYRRWRRYMKDLFEGE